jgi:hypothetical protein
MILVLLAVYFLYIPKNFRSLAFIEFAIELTSASIWFGFMLGVSSVR